VARRPAKSSSASASFGSTCKASPKCSIARPYRHVEVAVTDEVGAKIDDGRAHPGGVSNAKLESDVRSRFDDLQDHTVAARASDAALLALEIASAAELMQMLRGESKFPEAVMSTAAKVGTAASATALTALLGRWRRSTGLPTIRQQFVDAAGLPFLTEDEAKELTRNPLRRKPALY